MVIVVGDGPAGRAADVGAPEPSATLPRPMAINQDVRHNR
jgi:hypothetical protein